MKNTKNLAPIVARKAAEPQSKKPWRLGAFARKKMIEEASKNKCWFNFTQSRRAAKQKNSCSSFEGNNNHQYLFFLQFYTFALQLLLLTLNAKINKRVKFINLGEVDYKEAWDYQTELFDAVVQSKIANRKVPGTAQKVTDNYLIFCEHPHVYTLGKSGQEEHLLINNEQLSQKQATYYKINRGGDITYHGPGQLVGYPILDLDNFFTDIHKYLRFLEESIILTLKDYGLEAGRIDGLTGVWLDHLTQKDPRKICAIGVKSSRWVTMHGFAFNINTQLDYFDSIVPCGINGKAVTSLEKELGEKQPMADVAKRVAGHLAKLFEMELF